MRFRIIVSRVAAAMFMGFAGRATAGVFQNGSFESVSNPYSSNPAIFTSSTGWSVNYNGAAIGPDGDANVIYSGLEGASNGSEAVIFDADATDGVGSVYQSFSTNPGQTYNVAFDYGQFGYQHSVSNTLQVNVCAGSSPTAGNQLINLLGATVSANPAKAGQLSLTDSAQTLTIMDSAGDYNPEYTPAPNTELSSFAFTFTAQTATSTIVFTDASGNNVPADDGILDNVRIPAAVPEPTSLSAIIFGMAFLCRRHRR